MKLFVVLAALCVAGVAAGGGGYCTGVSGCEGHTKQSNCDQGSNCKWETAACQKRGTFDANADTCDMRNDQTCEKAPFSSKAGVCVWMPATKGVGSGCVFKNCNESPTTDSTAQAAATPGSTGATTAIATTGAAVKAAEAAGACTAKPGSDVTGCEQHLTETNCAAGSNCQWSPTELDLLQQIHAAADLIGATLVRRAGFSDTIAESLSSQNEANAKASQKIADYIEESAHLAGQLEELNAVLAQADAAMSDSTSAKQQLDQAKAQQAEAAEAKTQADAAKTQADQAKAQADTALAQADAAKGSADTAKAQALAAQSSAKDASDFTRGQATAIKKALKSISTELTQVMSEMTDKKTAAMDLMTSLNEQMAYLKQVVGVYNNRDAMKKQAASKVEPDTTTIGGFLGSMFGAAAPEYIAGCDACVKVTENESVWNAIKTVIDEFTPEGWQRSVDDAKCEGANLAGIPAASDQACSSATDAVASKRPSKMRKECESKGCLFEAGGSNDKNKCVSIPNSQCEKYGGKLAGSSISITDNGLDATDAEAHADKMQMNMEMAGIMKNKADQLGTRFVADRRLRRQTAPASTTTADGQAKLQAHQAELADLSTTFGGAKTTIESAVQALEAIFSSTKTQQQVQVDAYQAMLAEIDQNSAKLSELDTNNQQTKASIAAVDASLTKLLGDAAGRQQKLAAMATETAATAAAAADTATAAAATATAAANTKVEAASATAAAAATDAQAAATQRDARSAQAEAESAELDARNTQAATAEQTSKNKANQAEIEFQKEFIQSQRQLMLKTATELETIEVKKNNILGLMNEINEELEDACEQDEQCQNAVTVAQISACFKQNCFFNPSTAR